MSKVSQFAAGFFQSLESLNVSKAASTAADVSKSSSIAAGMSKVSQFATDLFQPLPASMHPPIGLAAPLPHSRLLTFLGHLHVRSHGWSSMDGLVCLINSIVRLYYLLRPCYLVGWAVYMFLSNSLTLLKK